MKHAPLPAGWLDRPYETWTPAATAKADVTKELAPHDPATAPSSATGWQAATLAFAALLALSQWSTLAALFN